MSSGQHRVILHVGVNPGVAHHIPVTALVGVGDLRREGLLVVDHA
jgi:hypothetical protein